MANRPGRLSRTTTTWHGTAFMIEIVVLLALLLISAMILLGVFSSTNAQGNIATERTNAQLLASNTAEKFSAKPKTGVTAEYYKVDADGTLIAVSENDSQTYTVSTTVRARENTSGVFYDAVIDVNYDGSLIYELITAKYVSGQGQVK